MLTACPKCGWNLVLLSSLNTKVCIECKDDIPWELDEKQESIYGDRKNETDMGQCPTLG